MGYKPMKELKGIYVCHERRCPVSTDGTRCRCRPYYKGRYHQGFQKPAVRDISAALTWVGDQRKGTAAIEEEEGRGRTFGSLGEEWFRGVEAGTIQRRRRGKPQPYSKTTIRPYRCDFDGALAEFHDRIAAEIDESEWQEFVDELRDSLSYSRLANIKAVASNIYAYASYRTRRKTTGVHTNPLRYVDLGANDGKRRERVAFAAEAAQLLAALKPRDRVPYGIAFYAGVRRIGIDRLEWTDVEMVDGMPGYWLHVRPMEEGGPGKVGDGRHVPIAEPLRAILLAAYIAQGRPPTGKVCDVSVMSGKLGERARKAWETAKLTPIGLHECRHTYCSFLFAAKIDYPKIQKYMGHTQLSTTQRYMHVIEEHMPREDEAAALNAYFAEREAG